MLLTFFVVTLQRKRNLKQISSYFFIKVFFIDSVDAVKYLPFFFCKKSNSEKTELLFHIMPLNYFTITFSTALPTFTITTLLPSTTGIVVKPASTSIEFNN